MHRELIAVCIAMSASVFVIFLTHLFYIIVIGQWR